MDSTEHPAKARSRSIDYAKKYWWAAAIVVPLLVALIGKWPFGAGQAVPTLVSQTTTTITGSKFNSDNTTTNNTITIAGSNFVLPDKLSIALTDPSMTEMARRAAQRLQEGDFAGAAKLLQQIPEHDRDAAVWTLLGVAYAGAGARDRAAEALKRAGDGSAASQAAKANLATLADIAPADARPLEVSAKAKDPNNPFDGAVEIPLSNVVAGELAKGADFNIYAFTAPSTYRDWIDIKIANKSNQLVPQITLFSADKVDMSNVQTAKNAGADLTYSFVAGPNARHYVKVTSSWGESSGRISSSSRRGRPTTRTNPTTTSGTLIRISSRSARPFMPESWMATMSISIRSRPTMPPPSLWCWRTSQTDSSLGSACDQDRNLVGEGAAAKNPAANVSKKFNALAHSVYYIEVTAAWSESAGDYALTIRPE